MRDFRNRPNPVRAKIRYLNNVLTVGVLSYLKIFFFKNGNTLLLLVLKNFHFFNSII